MRFDEVELETVTLDPDAPQAAAAVDSIHAPRLRRMLALLADLSLFAALAVGLSPLLPQDRDWVSVAALAGFVVVMSFYYFVGCWMLWGKTIGGAIFDVRVVSNTAASINAPSMRLKTAAIRWTALYVSMLTAGIGFLLALLPSRRSLADRMSSTDSVLG